MNRQTVTAPGYGPAPCLSCDCTGKARGVTTCGFCAGSGVVTIALSKED